MTIDKKDIKLLWGRAGGLCCYREKLERCKVQLVKSVKTTSSPCVVGEMAHNQPKKDDQKNVDFLQIDEKLTVEEKDSYANLILLCPTHHNLVDKNRHIFTKSKIKEMKKIHEEWFKRLVKRDYNEVVQHRIKFYNIILYACSLYFIVGLILMFRATEEGSFVWVYTLLYLFVSYLVYAFDEKSLLSRLDEYELTDKMKFRIRLLIIIFLITIFIPVFILHLWNDISVNQNIFVIPDLLGLPIIMLLFLKYFKKADDSYFLIGKIKNKSIE